jgi:tetratricopeptide (TPR) repeat protein
MGGNKGRQSDLVGNDQNRLDSAIDATLRPDIFAPVCGPQKQFSLFRAASKGNFILARSIIVNTFVLAASFAALFAAAPSKPAGMGAISFPVTGNREARARFNEGMLALHSFMYDYAHQAFKAAANADPSCAMAHWGDAMAHCHALWSEDDVPAARAALAAVANENKITPKERAYLVVARALWAGADMKVRREAWLEASRKMYADYPGDDEVALQYALALISNSERLRNTKRLMESAAISMEVVQRNPSHPGALHYLIHACDTADHAILALPAARQYAKTAPAASHALHMPSHIFAQLGMWREVAASNEASWPASEKEMTDLGKTTDDRDWHSYSWLAAAYLELGQVKKAAALIESLSEIITQDDGPQMRFSLGQMVRYYLAVTGRWDQLDTLLAPLSRPLPLEKGEREGSLGCALHAPGEIGATRPPLGLLAAVRTANMRAEAAMRAGDEAGVIQALAATKPYYEALGAWGSMMPPDLREREGRIETAYAAGARAYLSKTKESFAAAVAAFEKLAELREISGNPAFDPPAQQFLAEMLLAAGRPKEALIAFEALLARFPMTSRTLLGAARAAKAAGEHAIARERYSALAAQWKDADAELRDRDEVRAGAGSMAPQARAEP